MRWLFFFLTININRSENVSHIVHNGHGYKALPIKTLKLLINNRTMLDDEFWNDLKNGNYFIADVSSSGFESKTVYQVYFNGSWIADCNSYEEAETIANKHAIDGTVNIERL